LTEGLGKDLGGGLVVNVGELELVDSLVLESLDSSLESFGKHEIFVEGFLEDVVVGLDLLVLEGDSGILARFRANGNELTVLVVSHGDVSGLLLTLDAISCSGLVVLEFFYLVIHSQLRILFALESGQFSSHGSPLLADGGLGFLVLLTDIAEFSLEVLLELGDFFVVHSVSLGSLDVFLLLELLELTGDVHLDGLGFMMLLLSVVSLEILEDLVGGDEDFGDFNRLEVDAPSVAFLLHLTLYFVTDLGAVSEAIVESRVGDLVSDDGGGLLLEVVVSGNGVGRLEVLTQVGVSLHAPWLVICVTSVVVDFPDDHSLHVDASHFAGHLLRLEGHQMGVRGESSHLVVRALEAGQADLGSLQFIVVDDQDPLIDLSNDLKSLQVLQECDDSFD